MPQISQLEEEEERRIRKMENESLQEGVLGRAALHEIMTARLDRFNTEVKRYFERKAYFIQCWNLSRSSRMRST